MKQSVNPIVAIVVIVVVLAVAALVGWQIVSKHKARDVTTKPGVGAGAASGPPAGAPVFKGDPNAVPASGRGGPASGQSPGN